MVELVCWWCVHPLPSLPCFHLPMKYDDRRKIFTTIGNFCSWACTKAYAIDMGSARKDEYCSLLALMRKQALGRYFPLWPAPKRQCLASFGGTMTIEEFRAHGGTVEPPRIHWPFEKICIPIEIPKLPVHIMESSNGGIINGPSRLRAIENSTTTPETLRLKRSKPLVRAATSKLENVLGIKRTSNC